MSQRTCRCCGQQFDHPAPGALSTKRFCGPCMALPEAVRGVLERHQVELARLRKEVDTLRATADRPTPQPAPPAEAGPGGDEPQARNG